MSKAHCIYNRSMLEIRKTRNEDLERIGEIFSLARRYRAENGNPTQWGEDRPSLDLVRDDIERGNSYVVIDSGKIVGTFAYIPGIEETYLEIDGAWIDDAPYGTIHRIASDGTAKGIFDAAVQFAQSQGRDVRIDTHRDNATMLHLIRRSGFAECGIIIVDDGTPRIAFQKKI